MITRMLVIGMLVASVAMAQLVTPPGGGAHPSIVTNDPLSFRPDGTNEAMGISDGTDHQVVISPGPGLPTAVVSLFTLQDVAGNDVCNFYPNQGDGDTTDMASFYCQDPGTSPFASLVAGLRAGCTSTACLAMGPRDVLCGQKSVCLAGGSSGITGGNDGVYVGCGGGNSSICVGESSNSCANGSACVIVALDTDTVLAGASAHLILLGRGFDVSSGVTSAFVLGNDLRDDPADVTCSNCIRFGGELDVLREMILGVEFDPSPLDFTIHTTGAEGTDISTTGHLNLHGSPSTGSGTSANVILQHCPASGSGSTVNTCIDALTIDGESGVMLTKKITSDPCTAGLEGGIFYNDTGNFMCYCDGTNDLKISDNTACF